MAVTWDPAFVAGFTLSGGNLIATSPTGFPSDASVTRATLSRSTGKFYFEVVINTVNLGIGLIKAGHTIPGGAAIIGTGPYMAHGWGLNPQQFSVLKQQNNNSNTTIAGGYTLALGDVVGVAVDFDAGKIWFSYNNTWRAAGSPNPATGTSPNFTFTANTVLWPAISDACTTGNAFAQTGRFATSAFSYTPPSGFLAWEDPPNVGSAAGSSTVTGVSILPGVGVADGVSAVEGLTSQGIGEAYGESIVEGIGGAIAQATGSASGSGSAFGHPPYVLNYRAGLSSAGTVLRFYETYNDTEVMIGVVNLNDDVRWGIGGGSGLSSNLPGRLYATMTWPSPRWIAGVVIYSGIPLTNLSAEPSDSATFPAFNYGQGGIWAVNDLATGTPLGTYSGAHDLLKQRHLFNEPIFTSGIKITNLGGVDGATINNTEESIVWEIQGVGTFLLQVESLVSSAVAKTVVGTRHVVTVASTANANSSATGSEVQAARSTANARSTAEGSNHAALEAGSTAEATSTAEVHTTVFAGASAEAQSTATPGNRKLTAGATAEAHATLEILSHPSLTVRSSAVARSSADARLSQTAGSTAEATSTADGTKHASNTESSSAEAHSIAGSSAHVTMSAASTANARSSVSSTLHAQESAGSTANARSFILLPFGSRQALWVNPITTAGATWSGMPFESMAEIDGQVYAAGDDGIYLLTDDDDDGVPIPAEALWDLLDFGDPRKKRPGDVIIGGASSGALNIRVMNEQGSFNYPTHLPNSTKATNLRAKLGKGLQSRYIRFALTNTNGGAFDVKDVKVNIIDLSRHIGGKHA